MRIVGSLGLRRWGLALGILLIAAYSARADFTVGLNQTFKGNSPSGSSPWLSATFEQIDADTVRLTMISDLSSSSEFVSKWFFNLNPALNAAQLRFTEVSLGNVGKAPTIQSSNDAFNGLGKSGDFDILFKFKTSDRKDGGDRFREGSEIIYDVSLVGGGLRADDFNYSSPGGKLSEPGTSVARIRGTGPDGNQDGDVVDAAPAPAGIVLMASALPALLILASLPSRRIENLLLAWPTT